MPIKRVGTASLAGERMRSAGIRAADAFRSVRRIADRLNEELDDVTANGGVQVGGLSEEDSMVTSIDAVLAAHGKAASTG